MSAATVKRSAITVSQESSPGLGPYFADVIAWYATLSGNLSTGEFVNMTRYGNTFAQALERLEGAIAENGWGIAE